MRSKCSNEFFCVKLLIHWILLDFLDDFVAMLNGDRSTKFAQQTNLSESKSWNFIETRMNTRFIFEFVAHGKKEKIAHSNTKTLRG